MENSNLFVFSLLLQITYLFIVDGSVCLDTQTVVQNGYKMGSSVFRIVKRVSVLACVTECLTVVKCKSINFSNKTRTCHLNNEDATTFPTDVLTDADYYYSSIDGWPKSLSGPCEALTCGGDERCRVDRFHRAQCVTDEPSCGSPSNITNAVMTSEGQYPGATVTYECETDYLFCGTSNIQTCSSTGTWEGLDGGCGLAKWTNRSLPLNDLLPCPLNEEYKLIVDFVRTGNVRMTMSLQHGGWTVIQLDLRINYGHVNTAIFAGNSGGSWTGGTNNPYFPFTTGQEYRVEFYYRNGRFEVDLDGTYYGGFVNPNAAALPTKFSFQNDFYINQIIFTKV